MSKDSELFNSILFNVPGKNFLEQLESHTPFVRSKDIRYPRAPPQKFDPRYPEGVPPSDVEEWFYKNYDGTLVPVIIDDILDQDGCGSCWAFAATATFTDAIRLNMNRIYKDKACVSSPLFNIAFTCTGNINRAGGELNLYAEQVRNTISPYFVVAFSPKYRTVEGKASISDECEKVLAKWKEMFGKVFTKPPDVWEIFGDQYPNCTGCKGNQIFFPMVLFVTQGALLLSDFPLHEWGCFLGNDEQREDFCSTELLEGKIRFTTMPKFYKADKYSYSNVLDLKSGNTPPGINDMEQWIMAQIYNYGPVTSGFRINSSFMNFFRGPNKKSIYTAEILLEDIKRGEGTTTLGGHSVNIIGWGEESVAPVPGSNMFGSAASNVAQGAAVGSKVIKYWIVRNSWGEKWGDEGFFRVERGLDKQLTDAGVEQRMQFEDEFTAVYFAPYPNPDLYLSKDGTDVPDGKPMVNDMKEFFQTVPNVRCIAAGNFPEIVEEMTHDCNCRCGYEFDHTTKSCKKSTRIAGARSIDQKIFTATPTTDSKGAKDKTDATSWSNRTKILMVLALIIFAIFVAIAWKFFAPCGHRREDEVSLGSNSPFVLPPRL